MSVSIGAALAALVSIGAPARLRAAESPSACAATTVQYTSTRTGLPHVDARGLTGNLFYYAGPTSMDGRVNRSDGLVIYAGSRSARLPMKILWTIPRGAGRILRISGRRLDGDGRFVERWRSVGGGRFPAIVAVPSAGCWQLSMTSGKVKARILLRAIEPPAKSSCNATPVFRDTPPHPRFGAITWMPATPRSAGVAAVLFVTVYSDRDEAVIPAGGHFPGGPDTKFLWWAPQPGASLKIIGRRLDAFDARGVFRDVFSSAAGDVGNRRDQIIFPSTIDVPAAGCWSVTLRTGRSAGQVVFQVVPPS